ncbi:MAG: hypothetical protein AAF217_01505 [Pseudomonadota bacterium]
MVKSLLVISGMILANSGLAVSADKEYDTSVARAAAILAAEKLGELRGTIGYDEQPIIIDKKLLEKNSDKSELNYIRPDPVPEVDTESLPPVVENGIQLGFDNIRTGSVQNPKSSNKPVLEWEVFDSNGNPFK